MCDSFNGWTNRETWASALHIDNDQYLQETARDYTEEAIKLATNVAGEGEEIEKRVCIYTLSVKLREWVEDDLLTLENVSNNQGLFNMLTDIGSVYRVNWQEIAQGCIEEALQELKELA